MSAYRATKAGELERCLDSLRVQSLPPGEIVLVYDGPVDDAIHDVVRRFQNVMSIRTVSYPENRGLGHALGVGLRECRNPLVARMDTDDICLPGRFERQLAYFHDHPEVSVLGGVMVERYRNAGGEEAYFRRLPLEPEAVRRYARMRNPVNHPTVMFRKNDVEAAGGYQPMPAFEDFHLWVRVLMSGYNIANLDDALVEGRAGREFFARRGGSAYSMHELAFARDLRRLGYHSLPQTVRFVATRLPLRLAPHALRAWAYRVSLRRRVED